jgi:hypothetical protein
LYNNIVNGNAAVYEGMSDDAIQAEFQRRMTIKSGKGKK